VRPELLASATEDPSECLGDLMRTEHERVRSKLGDRARLGHLLLSFWLRRYCARSTTIGLVLETPWMAYLAPLVDPSFLAVAMALPLHERFTTRAYTRALTGLSPELAAIRVTRYGVSLRTPWPVRLGARAAFGFGLLPRGRAAVDLTSAMARERAWIREILGSKNARSDGFFLPSYLDDLETAAARQERTGEIGMALTLELWRRMFLEGEVDLARSVPIPKSLAA
jgi:hypothetical protein